MTTENPDLEPDAPVAEPVLEAEPVVEAEPVPAPEPAPSYAAPAASEPRPELLIGGAFLGGMILAKLLGRRRGH